MLLSPQNDGSMAWSSANITTISTNLLHRYDEAEAGCNDTIPRAVAA